MLLVQNYLDFIVEIMVLDYNYEIYILSINGFGPKPLTFNGIILWFCSITIIN